jgi:hypothetical protein
VCWMGLDGSAVPSCPPVSGWLEKVPDHFTELPLAILMHAGEYLRPPVGKVIVTVPSAV